MRWISSILVATFLIQVGYVPCAAEELVTPKGGEIERSKFKVGMYVEVTYCSEKGKKETAKGYIRAVEDDAIIIGRGLWKERIAYRDILSLRDPRQKAVRAKVVPGARVRITAPSVADHRLVGTVVTLDADTLKLRSKKQAVLLAIPVSGVAKLDVNTGRKRNFLKGAAIGAVSVGSLGAVIGLGSGDDDPDDFLAFTAGEKAMINAIYLGGLGLVMGTLIGAIVKTEKWESVPVDRIRIGISPQRQGGMMLSASFGF